MRFRAILIPFALAAALSAHGQNLLTNGSFESLDGLGGATSWSFMGDASAFAANAYVLYAGGSGVSPDGTNLAAFNAGNIPTPGSISQSFSTVLGKRYTLSFDFGQFGGNVGDQTLTYSLTSGLTTLATTTFVPTSPTTNLSNVFQNYTTTFVGTGGTVALSFSDVGTVNPGNNDLLLDNASVTAVPGPLAAVPFALMALRRRRKA